MIARHRGHRAGLENKTYHGDTEARRKQIIRRFEEWSFEISIYKKIVMPDFALIHFACCIGIYQQPQHKNDRRLARS